MNKGIGYCGLVCDMCHDDLKCTGCKQGGCFAKKQCINYQCCNKKGIDGCYECEKFPCLDTILHKVRIRAFCLFIKKYGKKQLLQCLQNNEKTGIYYHKNGTHYGDYDKFDKEEDIINLLLKGKKI